MLRKVLTGVGVLLVGFHVWLLGGQVWDGRLDAALLARWAVAGGLVWGLARLRRQGLPLFRSRQAVAIWLLAALLHGPAVAERFGAPGLAVTQDVVATVAQIGLAASIVAGLALLFVLVTRWWPRRPARAPVTRRSGPRGRARLDVSILLLAPRPPPAA